MAERSKQIKFDDPRLKTCAAFGGVLMKRKRGRLTPRPVSMKHPMHLVLRSSQAKGPLSFLKTENRKKLERALSTFSKRNGVIVLKVANVGNHLHLMLRFRKRALYYRFIRGLTSAIAMGIGGNHRWNKDRKKKFWDYRPFTKIIDSSRHYLTSWDYLSINELEGSGVVRNMAEWLVKTRRELDFGSA